jgi:phage gpG-like protein
VPPLVLPVEGARTLRSTLKKAGHDLEQLKRIHAQVAQMVAGRAASLAPHRSGRLANTIRSSGTNAAAIVRAGRNAVPYAGPIHWGWPSRPKPAKNWRGGPIKANPFIYTAAENTQPSWEHIYLAALETIIRQIEGAPGP